MSLLTKLTRESLLSHPLNSDELLEAVLEYDESALFEASHSVTRQMASRVFDICTIVNAKSGRCSEDCRWCAQSRHWKTDVKVTEILPIDTAEIAIDRAEAQGIRKFSFVTAGRKISRRETEAMVQRILQASARPEFEICASLGLMHEEELQQLKAAGLTRLHCNLETGKDFFPKVCTTHTREEKIETLKAARRVGLEICSGGLFGMGESWEDRIELAQTLNSLKVHSIPLNFLSPIAGTPMQYVRPMPASDVLKTIALFRLINPKAYLRFAGGLSRLSRETIERGLYVGINSAIVGDFLTTAGLTVESMLSLALKAGYQVKAQPRT